MLPKDFIDKLPISLQEEAQSLSKDETFTPVFTDHKETNVINNGEIKMAQRLLGLDIYGNETLIQAAKFISCKRNLDEEKRRMGKLLFEDDPEYAVLFAFDIDRTIENKKTLHEVCRLLDTQFVVTKNEIQEEQELFEVVPGHYTANDVVKTLIKAKKFNSIFNVSLGGKYSGKTKIVKDPDTGMLWLIKPGSILTSPALGINEDRATQAQREAAFYAVAQEIGLGMAIPRVFLVKINGINTAVMPFLPLDFRSIESYKKEDPNKIAWVLEKYRKSGMLHMWAILEWILGSVDSHSNNLLMSEDGSIALIDHGSTFAGKSFDPANDPNSFVPYYLRYRVNQGFKKLSPDEKLAKLPVLDYRLDTYIKEWLSQIDPYKIEKIIKEFGINPEPSIQRLNNLRQCSGSISDYVNCLWTKGNPLAMIQTIKKEIIKDMIQIELNKKEGIKLAAKSRKNKKTGEIEYLLYRSMVEDEVREIHKNAPPGQISSSVNSTWTPDYNVAKEFVRDFVVSAWIPSHSIYAIDTKNHEVKVKDGFKGYVAGEERMLNTRE